MVSKDTVSVYEHQEVLVGARGGIINAFVSACKSKSKNEISAVTTPFGLMYSLNNEQSDLYFVFQKKYQNKA